MRYRSFHQAMSERFGCKVYKLALDGGMTCPNRDGKIHTKGCIFCSDVGSGDFAEPFCEDISLQIERAKLRVKRKMDSGKYIAYFQSFTNTYAPVDYLEKIFRQAMSSPDIVALSVATRPDCLPSEIIDLLSRLNQEKPVWVELGLQTIHPKTVQYIRRGYPNTCFEEAVAKLKQARLEVIVHMILGLPGETHDMMLQTAKYIASSGVDGVKLQLLHVLEGTDLAQEYRSGTWDTLTLEAYIEILEDCIRVLPPNMVIHRLTGDGAKKSLLAPLWSGDKKRVLNQIRATFERDDIQQGSCMGHEKITDVRV